jgi:hypothetical protein
MKNFLSWIRQNLNCLVILLAAGCGADKAPLAEVEGTLTWNGRALPGIIVEFIPDVDKGTTGPRSLGVTDEKGCFVLKGDDQTPGAVIGHHLVVIYESGRPPDAGRQRDHHKSNDQAPRTNDSPSVPANLISPIYKAASSTPLKREVVAGKQSIDLKLP